MEKLCSKCKQLKEYSEFHKAKSTKDGYFHRCKPCQKIESSKYFKKNKDRLMKYQKEWSIANPGYYSQHQKEWRQKHKDGWFYVYLLDNEHYVGQTEVFDLRMKYGHQAAGRDISVVTILDRFRTKKEATTLEAEYHKQGYKGSTADNFYSHF